MEDFKEEPPGPHEHEFNQGNDLVDDQSIKELPSWWRSAINEFDEHDLPPYQPPRFSDGAIKPEVVERLEEQYDINISFIGIDTRYGDDWHVRIDDELIGQIGHVRASKGFTVFKIDSEDFKYWIQDELENNSD